MAVNEDVTCRLQQLTAENGRLWLFAITQHQNALANAQALHVSATQLDCHQQLVTGWHRPCRSRNRKIRQFDRDLTTRFPCCASSHCSANIGLQAI